MTENMLASPQDNGAGPQRPPGKYGRGRNSQARKVIIDWLENASDEERSWSTTRIGGLLGVSAETVRRTRDMWRQANRAGAGADQWAKILNYLHTRRGETASIPEISKATGVPRTMVHDLLRIKLTGDELPADVKIAQSAPPAADPAPGEAEVDRDLPEMAGASLSPGHTQAGEPILIDGNGRAWAVTFRSL